MPIPSKPPVLRNVIGYDADVFSLPDTTVEGSGALSYESGWPRITGTSLKAGGKAPQREYFNQVNKLLSQHLFFLQSGNIYDWDAALNYNAGAHVLGSDGLEYVAISPSGPDVPGVGAKDPAGSRNKSQWLLLAALLMSSDGGLVVDPVTGKGSVDFEQMPTDKFEALLKSIRVPIWLTRNKTFYVNGTTGSDTLDDGRGESEGKPFKTIQAAVNYVCDNYNLSRYNANIIIADGTYETGVFELPQYSATTGTLRLAGTTIASRDSVIIKGCVFTSAGNSYILQNLTIDQADAYSHGYAILSELGRIDLYNVVIDASDTVVTSGSLFMLRAEGGTVRVWASTVEGLPGIIIKVPESCNGYLYVSNGGRFYFSADIAIQNNGAMMQGGVYSSNGIIQRQTSDLPYPGRLAVVTTSGTLTGRRYIANLNGIVDSLGGGADFFPGSIAGATETGGQYA